MQLHFFEAKLPNLKLKTQPIMLLFGKKTNFELKTIHLSLKILLGTSAQAYLLGKNVLHSLLLKAAT